MSNWKVEISPFTKKESLEFTDQVGNKVTIHNMSSSTLDIVIFDEYDNIDCRACINRNQVKSMISHLQSWLDTASLKCKGN